jgi:hypothetical protein
MDGAVWVAEWKKLERNQTVASRELGLDFVAVEATRIEK